MAGRTIDEEVVQDLAGKAVIWWPAIAGAVLLGPAGVLLGLITTGVIGASGNGNSQSASGGEPAKK